MERSRDTIQLLAGRIKVALMNEHLENMRGLGESAGVNRFEDKALAGSVRIVPPTLITHKRPRASEKSAGGGGVR